jgi:hypothetical protein
MKMFRLFSAFVAALILSVASNANAATFSFSGLFDSHTLNALITTEDTHNSLGANAYTITSISGTLSGYGNITGIIANPNQPNDNIVYTPTFYISGFGAAVGFDYDNNLFPAQSPMMNKYGVAFTLNGGLVANLFGGDLWGNISPNTYTVAVQDGYASTSREITIAQTPLPPAFALFASSILAMGGAAFAKGKKARNQA